MNKRILIVDDDPELRELLRGYLGDNGFEVDVAEDGAAMYSSTVGLLTRSYATPLSRTTSFARPPSRPEARPLSHAILKAKPRIAARSSEREQP